MRGYLSELRRPIKRVGAEKLLLMTLFSFAASVTLTRLFLALTGYPQLGGEVFHFAHALWGGLLLYIAALLPLLFANRWVYTAGAALTGMGVGLFIDEVGKFITQSNDYFFPLAAPIVYAFFLLTVLIYTRVSRPPARSVRSELFHAFDALEEVLEQDLDPAERAELEERLRYVAEHSTAPDLTRLANALMDFLRYEQFQLAQPPRPRFWQRMAAGLQRFEARRINRVRLKVALVLALIWLGLTSLAETAVVVLLAAFPSADPLVASSLLDWMQTFFQVDPNLSLTFLLTTNLVLETITGLALLAAGGLLLVRRENWATVVGSLALLFSLTAVNLLVFYYDQFSAVVTALFQLLVLLGLEYYQEKWVEPEKTSRQDALPSASLRGHEDAKKERPKGL
jgi:hypothetical protein